jgi:hypothetical protein
MIPPRSSLVSGGFAPPHPYGHQILILARLLFRHETGLAEGEVASPSSRVMSPASYYCSIPLCRLRDLHPQPPGPRPGASASCAKTALNDRRVFAETWILHKCSHDVHSTNAPGGSCTHNLQRLGLTQLLVVLQGRTGHRNPASPTVEWSKVRRQAFQGEGPMPKLGVAPRTPRFECGDVAS